MGNPGAEYRYIRHNIGWMIVGALREKWRAAETERQFQGRVSRKRIRGRECLLLTPLTYMNRSGASVALMCRTLQLTTADLLVVFDAADLDFGTLRLRRKGGSGGHNGVQSIIDSMGSENFPRLKFGISGAGREENQLKEYVLAEFTPEEKQDLPGKIAAAVQRIEGWAFDGIDAAMNRFN